MTIDDHTSVAGDPLQADRRQGSQEHERGADMGSVSTHGSRADAVSDQHQADLPWVYTARGRKRRKIRSHDLSLYQRPVIPGNRNALWRAAWYLVNAWFFQSAVLALIPSSWKARILRAFGARVGKGLVCKPRVTIKYPWFLEIGDHVWLGELVWIDNHTTVKIGNSVCISQGAYLFTGNHDWNDPAFRFFCAPIEIGDGCWVGAGVRVRPAGELRRGQVSVSNHAFS
jgi:putative colanic acid biosynthesis acetyltransferase WcaF